MTLYAFGDKQPRVGRDAWVAPGAHVIGDVVLGDDASVWFNATIRADNSTITVGNRSNVQDGAMLHSDDGVPLTLGDDVTVGHLAILHGCTVQDGSMIGMGAVVLNRAVIGRGCIVGAGALVTEGKVFPDNCLIVGSPARVVRQLDEAARIGLLGGAQHYVDKAAAFRDSLRPIDPA